MLLKFLDRVKILYKVTHYFILYFQNQILLIKAREKVVEHRAELDKILVEEGWTESILPEMKIELQNFAQEAKDASKKSRVPLTLKQQDIEGHYAALKLAEKKQKALPSIFPRSSI